MLANNENQSKWARWSAPLPIVQIAPKSKTNLVLCTARTMGRSPNPEILDEIQSNTPVQEEGLPPAGQLSTDHHIDIHVQSADQNDANRSKTTSGNPPITRAVRGEQREDNIGPGMQPIVKFTAK
jgi:hypothetical protein